MDEYMTGGFSDTSERANYQTLKNSDSDFMQWLFTFSENVLIPQRNTWYGLYLDENLKWIKDENSYQVMNPKGISWGISFITSYINPVFIVSNFDEEQYNFRMREVCHILWNTFTLRWKEFGMKKTDIPRVIEEIESKVQAILLGARGDGYRKFFSTTRNISEHKQLMNQNQSIRNQDKFSLNPFKKGNLPEF